MGYVLEFELKGLPKLTNQMSRGHWRKRYGHTNLWKQRVFSAVGGKAPVMPLPKAKLTLTRHSSREPDFDGLVSGFKPIIDGLVECRVLENDKMKNIGQPEYVWVKANPCKGKVTIKVEEICLETVEVAK